jgi:hypothetical protein
MTIESPSRMRCDSLRERTSIEQTSVYQFAADVTMYSTPLVFSQYGPVAASQAGNCCFFTDVAMVRRPFCRA